MTRSKSDAQLDAEAAGPVTERPLSELVEDHRHLYRADLALYRLHGSVESIGDDSDSQRQRVGREYGSNGHPATWTGMPYSHPFLRFIDWDRRNVQDGVRPTHPGQAFPWSTGFYAQWADCRRYHPEHHGRPEWRGSLCRQLVSLTVRSDLSLESACLVLGVTPPRASRTLRTALLWIEGSMGRAHRKQTERDRPLRERVLWRDGHERHGLAGMHREDCPQCRVA